jgi:hypothetical protein
MFVFQLVHLSTLVFAAANSHDATSSSSASAAAFVVLQQDERKKEKNEQWKCKLERDANVPFTFLLLQKWKVWRRRRKHRCRGDENAFRGTRNILGRKIVLQRMVCYPSVF